MHRADMAKVMEAVFRECQTLREAGQREYAQDEENAFRNFEWIGEYLQTTRERVLAIYAMKHWDGIASWINGHRSQRENVRGRINDLIVYLCLLRGMVEEDEDKVLHHGLQRKETPDADRDRSAGPTDQR